MLIGPRPAFQDQVYSPKFTAIRPSTSGSGGSVEIPAHWCVISQAAPTTASYEPANAVAYSDANIAFEGAADSTKTIIVFEQALTASSNYLLSIGSGHTLTSGQFDSFITLSAAAAGTQLGVNFRARPITAVYNIAGLTWNTFLSSPPTMGLGSDIYPVMLAPIPTTGAYRFRGYCPPIGFQYAVAVYGVVIDIDCGSGSPATTVTLSTVQMSIPVFNSKLTVLSMD